MALIVQKYGGTSVRDLSRIRAVAEKIAKARDEGHDLVVVVSAMAGETDKLLELAHALTPTPEEREVDMLLSSGERVTSSLMAIALQAKGYPAIALTGRQVGIITDTAHTTARVKKITAEKVRDALSEGKVAVVAGFQGISEKGEVTTLGRGGSDLTAVAIAAALKADRCEIYTDVDGVYTADPNVVPKAKRLDNISYDEMMEMASLGAKVLHTRSVELARKYEVPLVVLSSFTEGGGTLVVREEPDMEAIVVSSVNCDLKHARLTIQGVPDRPGVAAEIFRDLSDANINLDMIVQNVSEEWLTDISLTLPKASLARAEELFRRICSEIGARDVSIDEDIAKVSIVGLGMKSHAGVATRMFETLAAEGINIMMISTSEISVACVVEAKYAELAVRTLHKAFGLEEE